MGQVERVGSVAVDEAIAWAREQLERVDPETVVAGLEAAGWVQVGGRAGVYTRLAWLDPRYLVVVPLDASAPEYRDLMVGTLADLKKVASVGAAVQQALDGIGKCPTCYSPGVRPLYPAPCEDGWHDRIGGRLVEDAKS